MNVHLRDSLESLTAELTQINIASPQDELLVWKLIARSPSERVMAALLAKSLSMGKVTQSVGDWSAEMKARGLSGEFQHTAPTFWWRHPKTHQQMVLIPPGRCLLGPHPQPTNVDAFSLARFPTTNREYQQFVEESGYQIADDQSHGEYLPHFANDKLADDSLADHPVTWVNAVDAMAYCQWAGGELPEVLDWEKAARGPDGRLFPWGNEYAPATDAVSNLNGSSTCAVGSYPATRSPYGCEDLSGNVSQWCVDPSPVPTYRPQRAEQHPVRGGCFFRRSPRTIKASHQRWLHTQRRNQWVGFRLSVK